MQGWRGIKCLAPLVLLALALRLPGADWRLPHVPVVDEVVLHRQASTAGERAADPAREGLEHCYPRLLGVIGTLARPAAPQRAPRDVAEHRDAAARDLLRLRQVLAGFSVLVVPLTYLLARKFQERGPALLAAAFVTTSLLHVWYAPEARPHPAVAVTSAAAVLAAIALQRRPTAARYAGAGLACGLAIATLQSGLATLVPLVGAHVLRARRTRGDLSRLALAVAAAAAVALPLWPRDSPRALGGDGLFGHGVHLERFTGGGFWRGLVALRDYEPVLALLAAVAFTALVIALARGRDPRLRPLRIRPEHAIVLAHAIAYLAPMVLYAELMQRFLIPVLPYLAIAAAAGATAIGALLARAVAPGRARAVAAAAPGLLALAAEGTLAVRVLLLRTRPDTETLAARWLEEHARPEQHRVALSPTLELPLLRVPDALPAGRVGSRILFPLWTTHQTLLGPDAAGARWDLRDLPLGARAERELLASDPRAWAAGVAADLFVLEEHEPGRREILGRARDALGDVTVLARFDPAPAGPGPLRPHLDGPMAPESGFAWRVLCATAIGPRIEILRREP